MDCIHPIGHLFDFSASGRKLSQRKTAPADPSRPPAPPASSIAGKHAGIYLRGLLEAKTGDRNFEDIAETVPGADHQRVQHFRHSAKNKYPIYASDAGAAIGSRALCSRGLL